MSTLTRLRTQGLYRALSGRYSDLHRAFFREDITNGDPAFSENGYFAKNCCVNDSRFHAEALRITGTVKYGTIRDGELENKSYNSTLKWGLTPPKLTVNGILIYVNVD